MTMVFSSISQSAGCGLWHFATGCNAAGHVAVCPPSSMLRLLEDPAVLDLTVLNASVAPSEESQPSFLRETSLYGKSLDKEKNQQVPTRETFSCSLLSFSEILLHPPLLPGLCTDVCCS